MANDYFAFRHFVVHQGLCAMKVGTDGTLLGAWASLTLHPSLPLSLHSSPATILDIGTGTGLIALMMAQRYPEANVVGIDIDPGAVMQACENVARSPFAERITIIEGDVTEIGEGQSPQGDFELPYTLFDCIVCNPPYFVNSLESPDAQRNTARHANRLTYRQLMETAWRLLDEDGELSVVIPFDCKKQLEAEATITGFFKVRECAVKTTQQKPPRRYLMALRKHPAPIEQTQLVVGSDAYKELTNEFYY